MPDSSVIKYPGGKTYLAKWIIFHMPKHVTFCEPYFGGGAVMLAKSCDNISEIANDANQQLMTFWQVLKDEKLFPKLARRLEASPFCEKRWNEIKAKPWPDDPLTVAEYFFILVRQSRQGLSKDFATMTKTRTRQRMNEQVSAWISAIHGLPEVHARLQRIVLLNKPAVAVIKQLDDKDTLYYCDPPYLHSSRVTKREYGDFEMTPEQHQELLETLAGIKGKFLLSGYFTELYDKFAKKQKWRMEEKLIPNQASSKREKELKRECLWMNYKP